MSLPCLLASLIPGSATLAAPLLSPSQCPPARRPRTRTPTQAGQPTHPADRAKWPWWKAKKWVLHISYRLFTRYGAPDRVKPGNDQRFAALWAVRRRRGKAAVRGRSLMPPCRPVRLRCALTWRVVVFCAHESPSLSGRRVVPLAGRRSTAAHASWRLTSA